MVKNLCFVHFQTETWQIETKLLSIFVQWTVITSIDNILFNWILYLHKYII